MLTWLAWSCFNLSLEDVHADPERYCFLERILIMLEARTGTSVVPGKTGTPVMRLTLDPVNVVSRPYITYLVTNSVNYYLRNYLYPSYGVNLHCQGGIE